ncbi:hypothetical protein NDU88_004198 [Pleurodeles waltl]|uniref:Uncharacterized protein n=1 Tax=Pleurodeles waltl TaxID=8319 RepID=A0AAV7LTZ1_PLEWA|nr:hypothetical protein NDU88_004198 [Pleurodeles waltl]
MSSDNALQRCVGGVLRRLLRPGRPERQRSSAIARDSVMEGAVPAEDAGRCSSPGGRTRQSQRPRAGPRHRGCGPRGGRQEK